MSRKIRVLLVGDSAMLDTGFARAIREIGSGLAASGDFVVAQIGLYHKVTERFVPFQIYGIGSRARDECYGEKEYAGLVERFRPDVVIGVGEVWAMKHMSQRPRRDYKLIGYFPIDGVPVSPDWVKTMMDFDLAVLYGEFGRLGVLAADPEMAEQVAPKLWTIPLGVDIDVFHPRPDHRDNFRRSIVENPDTFLVGCVARNNARKQLPRLLKAYKLFISPWFSCSSCGFVGQGETEGVDTCPRCDSKEIVKGEAKKNTLLYLHCNPKDSAGHDILALIDMMGLGDSVRLPMGLTEEGVGCSDATLARVYNTFDVFTLPTGGEGWCLPVMEGMASGVPCLTTGYSGHLDFCRGASELIEVAEWITMPHNCAEHALVDLNDYTMKLDRFYMEPQEFVEKWGGYLQHSRGMSQEDVGKVRSGEVVRKAMAADGVARARTFAWGPIITQWVDVIKKVVGKGPAKSQESQVQLTRV